MLIMGGLTAIAFFVFILKLPAPIRRRLLGFDLLVDVAATCLMMIAFAGSFAGMAAAIVGGLIFSALLIIAKWIGGYEKAVVFKLNGRIRFVWTTIPPIFNRRGNTNVQPH
jgi:hypothetical protein